MHKIIKRPQAVQDLLDIHAYIAAHNPAAADKTLYMLEEKAEMIARHPMIGSLRDELDEGVRLFPADSYVLIYKPVIDGVEIIRYLHGHRYLQALLF